MISFFHVEVSVEIEEAMECMDTYKIRAISGFKTLFWGGFLELGRIFSVCLEQALSNVCLTIGNCY